MWIDLEMTGLDPRTDRILELASIITDSQLNIVAHGPSLVIYQPDDVIENMDSYVHKMHTSSGLLERVRESVISIELAAVQLLDFIKSYSNPQTGLLAGNSVWQDRNFLHEYMPEVISYLHYRMVDVSTVKELAVRWYPGLPQYQKKRTHRALDDIVESIEELRHYRSTLFR